jgi:hypothetical protein
MKTWRLTPLLACLLLAPQPLAAWGSLVHQAVTGRAIDTLPSGLRPFYRGHRLELPTLALEPNLPAEGPERRFAIDALLPFPFAEFPRNEAAAQARFGEALARVGRLPWLVKESHARLVQAFKAGDKQRILEESDLLAGLVTDLHNPLALTQNADGQATGQHGLWIRFSERFPEAVDKALKLDPDAAHYLDDPDSYIFAIIADSYVWLDNLLYQEDLARRGQAGYTELYYETLGQRAGLILRDRLSRAAGDVGSYWYTAWTAAGRPQLKRD